MAGDLLAHFETGKYKSSGTFLEDAEYGRALDCFVKGVCVRCYSLRLLSRALSEISARSWEMQPHAHGDTPIAHTAGCADILIQDEATGEVLIAKRRTHPQPDWWYLGGRMRVRVCVRVYV